MARPALVAADGRVHGFTRGGGGWSPSGTLAVERAVVALDGTGARAAIADDTRRAIWRRDGATWREEATLMGGGARAVAIDRAGARGGGAGLERRERDRVHGPRRDADGWHDDGDLPAVPDASPTSPSLALAADGTRVVIATPTRAAPLGQGAAWSFVRGAAGWQLEALIVPGPARR
jgi:hypothetical protein